MIAINNSGTVLGSTCTVINGGCSKYHGYIWTPLTPNAARSVTAGFGANQEPLADARGSERSRDRQGAVAEYRKKPDGQRTSGTVTEIVPPAGFDGVTLGALNGNGDIVGVLSLGFSATPFLESGGVIYDLSAIDIRLEGGIPMGINDAEQIVITTGGLPFSPNSSVYLLTPIRP